MTDVTRTIGSSIGAAVVWAAVLRVWMRFVSSNPEFSWGGTAAILAVGGVAGLGIGIARWRRQAGGRGWWRLSVFASLPVFAGPGLVMLPGALAGAAWIGRARPQRRWIGVAAAAGLGFGAVAGLGSELPDDRWLPAGLWLGAMVAAAAHGGAAFFCRRTEVPVDSESKPPTAEVGVRPT